MSESRKRLYTTGEASNILGVSASTVIRRFDGGELAGKRHPVTGKRLVDRESLERFLAEHGLSLKALAPVERRLLIVDSVRSDVEMLRVELRDRPQIAVDTVAEGCEACGRVMEWRPDLAVVNVELSDMPGRDVVRCLRRLPLPNPVQVILSTPAGVEASPELLAELEVDERLPKPWRASETATRIIEILGLADEEEPDASERREHRRWARTDTNWRALLKLYLSEDAAPLDTGDALVRDISEGGAFLANIRMLGGALPTRPFALGVHVTGGPADGFEAKCEPVRIECDSVMGLGVRFDSIDPSELKRIREALER